MKNAIRNKYLLLGIFAFVLASLIVAYDTLNPVSGAEIYNVTELFERIERLEHDIWHYEESTKQLKKENERLWAELVDGGVYVVSSKVGKEDDMVVGKTYTKALFPSVNEIINITHVETVYVYRDVVQPAPDVIPFKSLDELRQYVKGVLQSHKLLSGVCVDYAEMLWQAAYNDHRNIGIYGIYTTNENGQAVLHHWMNFAKVGNCIYQIEPQTGNIAMLQGWGEMRVK